ncbi:hypothetical protein CCACVL1_03892 [Corchorus capsularis]|uniref:Uncharacterized protein n=1 Tax=Corchorus capsularis TaxID=210143 RepID=A0A1R3JWJ1_COCAP|nr:hypothetical protein CCACVL1_03892 [Corchorus capsularis]
MEERSESQNVIPFIFNPVPNVQVASERPKNLNEQSALVYLLVAFDA